MDTEINFIRVTRHVTLSPHVTINKIDRGLCMRHILLALIAPMCLATLLIDLDGLSLIILYPQWPLVPLSSTLLYNLYCPISYLYHHTSHLFTRVLSFTVSHIARQACCLDLLLFSPTLITYPFLFLRLTVISFCIYCL